MKNKLKKLNYNKILFVIMTILVVIFNIFIATSHILPMKYLLLVMGIFLLWIVLLYFLLVFKTKKGKNKPRKIAGYIVSVILLILMGLVFYYLKNTLDFFDRFGKSKFKEETYHVLVLKDSSYEKIEDINNLDIGYIPNELSKIEEAVTKLNEKVTLEKKTYTGYHPLFDDLISKKITSILIEDSSMKIIEENNEYEDTYKIIYSFVIKSEIVDDAKEVDVTKDPFTIYISGIDTYGSINGVSRSDVNIIATVNPKTKQILLLSIPRDYYVQLKGTTGYKDKLTHAGLYGIETSIGTLEELLDEDINYYFRVNFSTLEKVINAIGGVDVYSKYEFSSHDDYGNTYHFYKGYNHLNGIQALTFSRERYSLPGGDRSRGENQQAVIDGIVRKATSSAIITKYTSILDSLKDTFQTSMTEKDLLKLIRMQLDDMAKWNITSYSLNGSDGSEYTYSYSSGKLYVMHPNQDTIQEAISLIDRVKQGEVLTGSYQDVSDVKNPTNVVPKPSNPTTDTSTQQEPSNPTTDTQVTEPSTPSDPTTDTSEPSNPDTPSEPDILDIPGMPENNEEETPNVSTQPNEDTSTTETPEDTVTEPNEILE